MKEKLYTIELTDAMKSEDECPFCCLERKLEQTAIEFVLGCSYMESDIRDKTDEQGFCRKHTKMMFDYGNSLGKCLDLKIENGVSAKGIEKADGQLHTRKNIVPWKMEEKRRNRQSGHRLDPPGRKPLLYLPADAGNIRSHAGYICLIW